MKNVLIALSILGLTIYLCYWTIDHLIISQKISYQDAGPMGDTIAGLTMPIISLVSIFFLYLSFSEQLEANKIQNKALQEEIKRSTTIKELDQILDLLKDVKEEIESLQITTDSGMLISGHDTIFNIKYLLNSSEHSYQFYIKELVKPLDLLEFICSKTESYNFELRDERVIYEKIRLIYPEDFSDGIEELIKNGNSHTDNIKLELYSKQIKAYHIQISKYQMDFHDKLMQEYNLSADEKLKMLQSKVDNLTRLSNLSKTN